MFSPASRAVRRLVERASRSREALLGVDHDVGDQPGARKRREAEQRGRRIAARVCDDRGALDPLAVQLGQAIDGLREQIRTRVLAVPTLVGCERGEPEVGAQIDHARAAVAQTADRRRGRRVGIGDDRRVELAVGVEVELLDLQRHAIAWIQVIQASADLRASCHRDQLEARMAPQ